MLVGKFLHKFDGRFVLHFFFEERSLVAGAGLSLESFSLFGKLGWGKIVPDSSY